MSINDNIGKKLDSDFENFNYLPQRLLLEDIDDGLFEFINDLNVSIIDDTDRLRKVPLIFLGNEMWAEQKINFALKPLVRFAMKNSMKPSFKS